MLQQPLPWETPIGAPAKKKPSGSGIQTLQHLFSKCRFINIVFFQRVQKCLAGNCKTGLLTAKAALIDNETVAALLLRYSASGLSAYFHPPMRIRKELYFLPRSADVLLEFLYIVWIGFVSSILIPGFRVERKESRTHIGPISETSRRPVI